MSICIKILGDLLKHLQINFIFLLTKTILTYFLTAGTPLVKSLAYALQQADETFGDNMHNEETPFFTEEAN